MLPFLLSVNLLTNGGFEEGPWRASPPGAFALDGRIVEGGRFSGRLSASRGRDVAAWAGASVKPYREYRLSLWIRTEGVPRRDGVWVEVVQLSKGREIGRYPGSGDRRLITTGGTHDWRRFEVVLSRLHPATDEVRVVLRLRRGEGRAWFDEVSLIEGRRFDRPAALVLGGFERGRGGWEFRALPPEAAEVARAEVVEGRGHTGAGALRFEVATREGRRLAAVWLRRRFESPQDWRGFEGLSVWVWPEGGEFGSLEVVLVEEGGAIYWLRRSAPAEPGWWQLLYPFDRFGLHPWSKDDSNGRLDLDRIVEVRLGFSPGLPEGFRRRFLLDDIGLYRSPPRASGPRLSLTTNRPNEIFFGLKGPIPVEARADGLRPGERCEFELEALDFWGRVAFRGRRKAEADGKGRAAAEFSFEGTGYFEVRGRLLRQGREAAEEVLTMAAVPRTAPGFGRFDPSSIFGIWVGGLRLPAKIGCKWTRSYFQPEWAVLDRKTGRWRLKNPDHFRNLRKLMDELGMEPIFFFRGMPRELSRKPTSREFRKFPPRDWREWADYVKFWVREAKRWGFRYYEVWNEPVPWAYWLGTLEEVATLHKVTYEAIKSVQPDAVVMGPCPYSVRLLGFLRKLFDMGIYDYLDALSVHGYCDTPEEFGRWLREIKALMREYSPQKPIFVTELGWHAPSPWVGAPYPMKSEADQANYLARSYLVAMAEGVRVLIWHMFWDWNDKELRGGYGILRHNGWPKPALVAYATLASLLSGARFGGEVEGLPEGAVGYVFEVKGRKILALWAMSHKGCWAEVDIGSRRAVSIDIMGHRTVLEAPAGRLELWLSESPIFVEPLG